MNNYVDVGKFKNICDEYLRFLKKESKTINMTPEEYGVMLQQRKNKKR